MLRPSTSYQQTLRSQRSAHPVFEIQEADPRSVDVAFVEYLPAGNIPGQPIVSHSLSVPASGQIGMPDLKLHSEIALHASDMLGHGELLTLVLGPSSYREEGIASEVTV